MSAFLEVIRRTKPLDCFETLLADHVNYLFHLSYRLTENASSAEDLLQDVLVKAYANRDALLAHQSPKAWLIRVTHNLHVDLLRRERLRPKTWSSLSEPDALLFESVPDDRYPANPLRRAVNAELRDVLLQAFGLLNSDQQTIVMLHLLQDYTLEECALILSQPVGTCRSRVFRARAKLRGLLRSRMTSPSDDVLLSDVA
jgi:RNA polymerase sigma factor (sigma-70 family)